MNKGLSIELSIHCPIICRACSAGKLETVKALVEAGARLERYFLDLFDCTYNIGDSCMKSTISCPLMICSNILL